MAIRYAVATGNWSSTSTWNGGTLPTSADDVYSNTFTVTIDTSPTVLSISNLATTGVTVGGQFFATNGNTLTCTGGGMTPASFSASLFVSSLTAGQTFNIVSNLSATSGNSVARTATNTGAGTLNITGNITGLNILAVENTSNGTITVTGNCTGGNNSGGAITNSSTGTITIIGNCTGGSGGTGSAVTNSSTGIINITGTCTGGSGSTFYAVVNNGSGTINHSGPVQSNSAPAINSGSTTQITILTGPFLTTATGINPNIATRWFWANSTPPASYYQIRTQNLATIRPLYTADSVGGNPAASNVRSGTVFGPASELTGTAIIPPASSVTSGVPVDNTTGTSALSVASIWNYPISGITTAGSIGERLKTAATVSTVNSILSNGLR